MKPKILVVDDEEDQQEIFLQRFTSKPYVENYQFVFANNGKEAYEYILDNQDIEILILDINMPKLDGLSLLRALVEKRRNIVTVILSAYGDMSNIRTAMNLGAFDFITKPVNFKDLESTLIKTITHAEQINLNAHTMQENLILKQKATELEMQALRAQMNPHFIFNSLNSVTNFILKNEKALAAEYLLKFSKLIRMILENSEQPLISLNQELEALRLYMDLEALRFENKFYYQFSHDRELDINSIKVPPLLVQPFVENSIHHGLMRKKEPGYIRIHIHENDQKLLIQIEDNGVGRAAAAKQNNELSFKKNSLGMKLTKDRISLLNNQLVNDSFELEDLEDSEGRACGTIVKISLPLII